MRSLTSIESSNHVLTEISFDLTASDQSTTWTFGHEDLVTIPTISWDIDFLGALGKTSNYQITLSSSLDFIKSNLAQFPNAETRLNVTVNSDTYQPHVGRVRDFKRNAQDPNVITLTVFDRFLDSNPRFPLESIQQSYSTVHPQVIDTDFGYPEYYGKHTRPFYHVPVDCSVSSLLGPRQVSSSNHNGTIFFTPNRANEQVLDNILKFNAVWARESSSTNIISNDIAFETIDTGNSSVVHWKYENTLNEKYRDSTGWKQNVVSDSVIKNIKAGFLEGNVAWSPMTGFATVGQLQFAPRLSRKPDITIEQVSKVFGSAKITDTSTLSLWSVGAITQRGNVSEFEQFGPNINSDTLVFSQDVSSSTNPDFKDVFLVDNRDTHYLSAIGNVDPSSQITCTFCMHMYMSLKSENYKNYSIYSTQVDCSKIAVTENPIYIISDVFSKASVPFLQSQSSDSQLSTNSYHFQCYFGERERLADIVQEFGELTQTYMWIGDSGSMNFRTYENSADVVVDATITTSDLLSFDIIENPLGIGKFKSQKADQIKVDYAYDFQKNEYLQSHFIHPNNSSFCDSANASGIESTIQKRTKYIIETDTSTRYLNTLEKKHTQAEAFVNLLLPAKFFQNEVVDVLKVQHPMIVGSESLYQVTNLKQNLGDGLVSITAKELILVNSA